MMEKMFDLNQNILPRQDVGQISSHNVTKVEQVWRVFRVFNLCWLSRYYCELSADLKNNPFIND